MFQIRTGLVIGALAVAIGLAVVVDFGVRDVVADWYIFGHVGGNGSDYP